MRQRLQEALGPNYELGDVIGRGGFAEVYVAWDRRLKREVAVKTLRTDLAESPTVVERFRREAEAVAQLRHPHVVPIYAVGDAAGIAFLIMPRIRGQSLAAALDHQPSWTFAEVCRILREAAGALAEAHRNGIVHRDVKPENIMLEVPHEQVVVMDFGIAKSLDAVDGGLTGTGMLLGTPQYMSPEQASGGAVNPLSDQYSLALVGYRLLAGRLPFESDSVRALLFMQVVETVPSVRELRPDVPEPLARALARALEKDPAKRFASMEEFADALAAVGTEIAGEFRIGRRSPPMADRWATALQHSWYRPGRLIGLAMTGLALFVLAYPRVESRTARRIAGARNEAEFVARSVLPQGAADRFAERRSFFLREIPYRFVEAALGRDSAEVLASNDVPFGRWEIRLSSRARDERWIVGIGASRRVVSLWHERRGSERPADIGEDSTLVLARRAISEHGWRLSDVRFVGSPLPMTAWHAVMRETEWSIPSRSIALGADTADFQIFPIFVGAELFRYGEVLLVPERYHSGFGDAARESISAVGWAAILGLVLISVITAVRRATRDTPQWGTGMRLGIVAAVIGFGTITLPALFNASVPWYASDTRLQLAADFIRNSLPAIAGAWLLITIFFVGAESLSYERRPDLTAGVSDLARGRMFIPEWIPAALAAYPAGLLGLGLVFAAFAAAHRLGAPMNAGVLNPDAFTSPLPVLIVVSVVLPAAVVAVTLFLAVAMGVRLHRPVLLTCALIVPLCWLYRFGVTEATEAQLAIEMVAITLAGLFLDRFGVLATIVALFVAFGTPVVADLIWSGGDPFVMSGVAGIGVLLIPAALAVIVYRRRNA
jgi:serine/threonine-protein kinase